MDGMTALVIDLRMKRGWGWFVGGSIDRCRPVGVKTGQGEGYEETKQQKI
jgi:hypothetical protein